MHSHDAWLIKAQQDLKLAKLAFTSQDPLFDMVVYHTQQCAEKALKGFLAAQKHPLQKTHNLVYLTEICMQIDQSFEAILSSVEILNPYATEFRYPDDVMFPEREDAEEAIKLATKIFNFVREKIEAKHGEINLDIFSYIETLKK